MNIEHFDVGSGVDESFNRIQDFAEVTVARRDDCDADPRALPLILVVDFSHRYVEPVAQSIDDRTDRSALDLQRSAFRNMEIETNCSRVHRSIIAPGTANRQVLT